MSALPFPARLSVPLTCLCVLFALCLTAALMAEWSPVSAARISPAAAAEEDSAADMRGGAGRGAVEFCVCACGAGAARSLALLGLWLTVTVPPNRFHRPGNRFWSSERERATSSQPEARTVAPLTLHTTHRLTSRLKSLVNDHWRRLVPFVSVDSPRVMSRESQFGRDTASNPADEHAKQLVSTLSSSSSSPMMTSSDPPLLSPFLWSSAPWLATSSSAKGPTALSNWIFAGALCVGGYPSAAESTRAHAYAQSMAECRFDTFVNLMTDTELTRFRPYADLVAFYTARLAPPMDVTTEFLRFPIADGGVPDDDDGFIAMIYELISRLKRGRRIYVHCWGGHGRTGTVVSVLLAVIEQARTTDEALEACQQLHMCRAYNATHRSPEPTQVPFVRRIVDTIRALPTSYAPPPTFHLQPLTYTQYEPFLSAEDTPDVDGRSIRKRSARDARIAQLAAYNQKRAGGGEGVIVVDSHGTASTTQATSSVPSTPLMSPARRISSEVPPIADDGKLLRRRMLHIGEGNRADSARDEHAASLPPPPPFTILQMNLLADSLCDSRSFPHTAAAALEWPTRKQLLLEELVGSNRSHGDASAVPQIICVQECDHFEDFFQPQLALRGYRHAFYRKKHSDDSADGVAIFVQSDRFDVGHHECITLEGMNQVLILLQLIPLHASPTGAKDTRRRLYVATTHLKAKEGFERVRLKQVQMIMRHLQRFIVRHHSHDAGVVSATDNPPHASLGFSLPTDAAVIFAGDLNDVPQSPMFHFIATGSAENAEEEQGEMKGETLTTQTSGVPSQTAAETGPATSCAAVAVSRAPPPSSPARHPFWFHSLYNRLYDPRDAANHPGPLYTTVKRRSALVQRCIDYVFYTPSTLRPIGMLSVPCIASHLPSYLPDETYPSDHLALAGRFEWA